MSTRSAIIVQTSPTEYSGIYVHSDGYLSWLGNILFHRFNTQQSVEQLVALGNLRGIHVDGSANAYHRDHGRLWDEERPVTARFAIDVYQSIGHDGHVYCFEDGEWSHNFKPLRPQLMNKNIRQEIAAFHNSDYPDIPPPIPPPLKPARIIHHPEAIDLFTDH